MTLQIHRARGTDILADSLGELLSTPLADPFAEEVVVVPARGVERWLTQRLSTGLRINRGADDPAGLIISERLRSDIQGNDQGIKNSDRASSVIALAGVCNVRTSARSLAVHTLKHDAWRTRATRVLDGQRISAQSPRVTTRSARP